MTTCVLRFGSKFAASETYPERGVGIGTGQGKASGDKAPARYPRLRTDRGRGVSTESRGLRSPAINWSECSAAVNARPADFSRA